MWIDRGLWQEVFRATQRVVAAGLLALLHHAVDFVFEHTLTAWPQILNASSTLAAVVFFVIYAALLFEAAAMFLPSIAAVLEWIGIKRGALNPRRPGSGDASGDIG